MNRRGVLQSAAAGLSLILPRAQTSLAAALHVGSTTAPVALVYDEGHDDARELAATLRARGTMLFATRGDATGIWYGALGTLLRRRGGTVAGLTTWPDLVIARSCGREVGLRLVFEGNDARGLTAWRLEPRA